ncbi:SU10 major capsid protein [Campylobacter concisus]|mgnify:CR=1 FL=1|jgi:hypothetical protein|uniref:DUF5309 domain-containing protein n=1 Tax=Campylobacter concisus TaxID=199 RepID=A0A1L9QZL0_9BACT|nr:DUF5309 family protein [Campylobacter concisus]DAJ21337.1 MAG TPA: Major capsid protein [Siphoviridae sp. ctUxW2]DAR09094.1 MAG TPA: Major capsid protein [Caudoviricetes sp.]DAX44224.1 MAG TPA: Major capsid protein [Bacteriophage sp.]MBE9829357.1 DUF5309 domain-containing protein [Campylobacter concisus]OJJ28084.1 hypothetical protein TH67_08300 [Campylobacter concisus]
MAIKTGLVTAEEAFGSKGVVLENTIKQIGWQSTPFYSAISTAAPADRSTSVAVGHKWFYDELPDGDAANAHAEGGAKATAKYFVGNTLSNHFQIVKNTYGVSGSQEPAKDVAGRGILANQGEMASVEHKKSIEKILLSSQTAVQRVNSGGSPVVGKCGGLKSFSTANNTIDANNTDLTMQMIRDLLKIGWSKGRPYQFLMVNDKQNDRLLDILDKIKQANITQKYLEEDLLAIRTSYGDVKVMLNPFLDQNEIIAFRADDIFKVNWRPMMTRELPTSNDAVEKEIISEFTLRVCTPVAFGWLKKLKV